MSPQGLPSSLGWWLSCRAGWGAGGYFRGQGESSAGGCQPHLLSSPALALTSYVGWVSLTLSLGLHTCPRATSRWLQGLNEVEYWSPPHGACTRKCPASVDLHPAPPPHRERTREGTGVGQSVITSSTLAEGLHTYLGQGSGGLFFWKAAASHLSRLWILPGPSKQSLPRHPQRENR